MVSSSAMMGLTESLMKECSADSKGGLIMSAVVTFGEIMGRVSTEGYYTLRQSLPGAVTFCFAGAEANVAASIALLGGNARFVTALPCNDLSEACIGNLRNVGIDTSFILKRDSGRLGLYFVQNGADQRPGKVIYDREGSSFSSTKGSAYDWDRIFEGATTLHVSGITPAVSRIAAEAQLLCMRKAKEHGLKVSFDCNFRSKLWNWEPGTRKEELAGRVIREMMPYVDILFAARIDAETLLDVHPGCPESYSRIDEQPYVAEAINRRYPSVKMLLTTMRQSISATYNKWGAALYDLSNGLQYVSPCIDGKYEPYDITAIVDRIGAGDSFAAGILYALDDSELCQDLQSVVDFATASSCLCHTIMQDINYVSREDVITLMKSGGHSTVFR